jgi:hypothetical protein
MTSILKNDNSMDSSSRRSVDDAEAMADQLERLERLVDSMNDVLADSKSRENQLTVQLEKQLQLMERMEQRLQASLTEVPVESAPSLETAPDSSAKDKDKDNDKDDDEFEGAVGLEAASFLQGWQKQRKEMLERMSQQEEVEAAAAESARNHVPKTGKKNMWDISPALAGASSDDIDEIQMLKDQLKQAMRDAEIELSMERAKMSNERLQMEKRLHDIERREKDIQRKSIQPESECGDNRVSRLKSFLLRRKNK